MPQDFLILIPARDWYHNGRYMGRAPEFLVPCDRDERAQYLADPALRARDVSHDRGAWCELERQEREFY